MHAQITEAVWPPAKAPVSPCPTLKVVSFVTALLDKKEELQRSGSGAGSGGVSSNARQGRGIGGSVSELPRSVSSGAAALQMRENENASAIDEEEDMGTTSGLVIKSPTVSSQSHVSASEDEEKHHSAGGNVAGAEGGKLSADVVGQFTSKVPAAAATMKEVMSRLKV